MKDYDANIILSTIGTGLGISLTSFNHYPEVDTSYSGYRKTDFMG